MPLVYEELRRIAHHYMRRERSEHTLQTTALINETYLRLVNQKNMSWQNRSQFLGVAAQLMRRILVDHARSHLSNKRGSGARHVALDEVAVLPIAEEADLIALDDALKSLEQIDQRKSQIVELRYFGGLTLDEMAEVLNVSPVTVTRDLSLAKAWLYREISRAATSDR